MRKIVFRGKRLDNGEWVYGDLIQNIDSIKIREHEKDIKRIAKSYSIDTETAGQYTGMKDKNGKRIFEGDIVRVEYTGSKVGDSGTGTVVFDGCMFAILWGWHKDLVCLTGFCNHKFEVIGNIHDNPEPIAEEQP